jgi:hypothetical protein
MNLQVKAWQLPPRLITGAYFLNAGVSKRGADDATAGQLHGFASGTYPPGPLGDAASGLRQRFPGDADGVQGVALGPAALRRPVGCINAFVQLAGTRGASRRVDRVGIPCLAGP